MSPIGSRVDRRGFLASLLALVPGLRRLVQEETASALPRAAARGQDRLSRLLPKVESTYGVEPPPSVFPLTIGTEDLRRFYRAAERNSRGVAQWTAHPDVPQWALNRINRG